MTTDYMESVREERAALTELGQQLAEQLGQGWTAEKEPDSWGVKLTSPGKDATAQLFLSFDRGAHDTQRRERAIVSGVYPHEWRNRYSFADQSKHEWRHVQHHEITVATRRGVETLAREVKRRLLPGYLVDLTAIAGWVREHEQYVTRSHELAEQFAATLGHASVHDRGEGRISVSWNPPGQGYATFNISETCVRMESGSFPPDAALRVAAALSQQ